MRPSAMARRCAVALGGLLLWTLGDLAGPLLHEALHDEAAPHVHLADGTIVTVSYGGYHRHADGTYHRHLPDGSVEEAPRPRRHRSSVLAWELPAAGGAHHLHRAALHGPAAVGLRVPVRYELARSLGVPGDRDDVATIDPLAPSARGPPRG